MPPKKTKREIALYHFKIDFGTNVRIMVRQELGPDTPKGVYQVAVTTRLRQLFDVQSSADRASYFEKAGLSKEEAAAESAFQGSPLRPEALAPEIASPRLRKKTLDIHKASSC